MNKPLTSEKAVKSYDPAYFSKLIGIEDRHFWFRARNQAITTAVEQTVSNLSPGYRALEIGCGTGNVLRCLEQVCIHGTVFGMDLYAEGLNYARKRTTCSLLQADMQSPPFGTKFSLIGLFDVLEHLPNDFDVLAMLHSLLTADGALIITVPAHQTLWSYFDEASHHCRRYEVEELESKLDETGFCVEYLTQYMSPLFPLMWLGRKLAALSCIGESADLDQVNEMAARELQIIPGANELLSFILRVETRWIARRRRLPIGTSLLLIARKVEIR